MTTWLIGEQNPYGTDPKFALYPLPAHAAGGRLCAVLGMSRTEYLRVFERRNLLDDPKWSAPKAREAASRVLAELADGDTVVLLGARVTSAFGLAYSPLVEFHQVYFANGRGREIRGVVVPHPSGRNRAWNDPTMAPRVREAVRGLVVVGVAREMERTRAGDDAARAAFDDLRGRR